MEQPISSNKSVLLNYKDEEKQLSESLYRNLHVLQRFHEPTAEFLQIFEPHMFIKSNARAFIYVMHFIFNCLDAAEFSRRFRWPILEKTGETMFRKTAVDYMNHLNVTHQLGLETLKLSNIHIPGGLKFIKIVHRFSFLVMKVEVNKPEHTRNGPLPLLQNIPDPNELLARLEKYVEDGMDFATRLQAQSENINERIDMMNSMMEKCLADIPETNDHGGCWTCVVKEWREDLDREVREEVAPKLEVVNVFSKRTVELSQLLTKLFVDRKENLVVYDRAELIEAQRILRLMNPDLQPAIDGIVEGNMINLDNLFKVFLSMLPNLMNKIETFEFRDPEAIEYEHNEIVRIDERLSKAQDERNRINELLQPFIEKDKVLFRKFCEKNKNLPFCLMQTPPVTRQPQLNRMGNRLGLTDKLLSKTNLFKEPPVRPASGNATMSKALSCTSLFNSSSVNSQHAALELLSKPRSRANLSKSSLHNMSTLGKFSTPKFSSTMSSMAGSNKMTHPSELKFTPSFVMTPKNALTAKFSEATSMLTPNVFSAVRKVATSSAFQPIIRSPTRRLQVSDIPRNFTPVIQANGNLADVENGTGPNEVEVDGEPRNGNEVRGENGNHSNGYHNGEALHAAQLEMDLLADDFIGNVSDTLLNDISSE